MNKIKLKSKILKMNNKYQIGQNKMIKKNEENRNENKKINILQKVDEI